MVKFCGYSLPHPNEKQVLIQIQVWPNRGITPLDALEKGLEDLKETTNALKSKFDVSLFLSEKEEEKKPFMSTLKMFYFIYFVLLYL